MQSQQLNCYIQMNEEQKSRQASQQGQSVEQLQALLKETIKENKSLQNKQSKLEAKYVEVLKETKALKKDHVVFTSFFINFFNGEGNVEPERQVFQEQALGQYELNYLRKLAEQKQQELKQKIRQLESTLEKSQKDSQAGSKRLMEQSRREMVEAYESKLKSMSEQRNKEVTSLLKDLDHLKKSVKQLHDDTASMAKMLQQKNNELSKANKEKLKLEHHLNNIRKKEIAEELSPQKQKQQEKLMSERNEFLSLRQQVESLMAKRDQLKNQLKEAQLLLAKERKKNEALEDEISRLKRAQGQMNEKYELIRQCTLEQLQGMILSHHFGQAQSNGKNHAFIPEPVPQQIQLSGQQSEQIQKQYLKNVLMRYIKAEISGTFEQSIMLLQVIANILKLDPQTSLALENYKTKRKQWWYIKY